MSRLNNSIYLDPERWEHAKQRVKIYDQDILTTDPAFSFVRRDERLPDVLLIGDSISISYTSAVRARLEDKANVYRVPTNGGWTGRGLEYLDFWLDRIPWCVIHFNWGLHDIKRFNPAVKNHDENPHKDDVVTIFNRTGTSIYRKNMQALTDRLLRTNARLIWAATTPVPEGCFYFVPGDENIYNDIAASIMDSEQVSINDLHGHIGDRLEEFQLPRDVHFNNRGADFLGERVAGEILKELGE